jgi:hypothetical protein
VFLFALIFTNLAISHHSIADESFVYCPLQKKWVTRDEDSKFVQPNLLDQICMSGLKKTELAIQISLKSAFATDEKGVFETLKFGVKVLDKYRQNRDVPQQTLAKLRLPISNLGSKNEWKTGFVANAETISFQQFSRPPTNHVAAKFAPHVTRTLEQISRTIVPRSPPFIS